MKKLALVVLGLVLLMIPVMAGCRAAPVEQASSCVTCHSNKDLLQKTMSVIEEEKSEATSGEG
ncbi:hypothetical protein ACFLX0_03125 [Chloroflexota bacterium]